jgi:hypothetical protein
MKKLILSSAFLVAGAISLLAQGAAVNFTIDPADYSDSATVDRLIYYSAVGVDPIANANYTAQLQEDVGGVWTDVGPAVNFIGDYDGYRGYWFYDNVQRTLSVSPGVPTSLRVVVYDETGTAFPNASAPFDYTQPPPPNSPTDFLMTGFRAFAVVPEPSAIALGVLGLGALLMFRRRK